MSKNDKSNAEATAEAQPEAGKLVKTKVEIEKNFYINMSHGAGNSTSAYKGGKSDFADLLSNFSSSTDAKVQVHGQEAGIEIKKTDAHGRSLTTKAGLAYKGVTFKDADNNVNVTETNQGPAPDHTTTSITENASYAGRKGDIANVLFAGAVGEVKSIVPLASSPKVPALVLGMKAGMGVVKSSIQVNDIRSVTMNPASQIQEQNLPATSDKTKFGGLVGINAGLNETKVLPGVSLNIDALSGGGASVTEIGANLYKTFSIGKKDAVDLKVQAGVSSLNTQINHDGAEQYTNTTTNAQFVPNVQVGVHIPFGKGNKHR